MDDLTQRAREALVEVTPGPWRAVAAGQAADLNEVVRWEPFQSIADVEGPDARFIAAARDLVPAMADRIEAQEALLKEAMEALTRQKDQSCEGFCEDLPHAWSHSPDMDLDCGGCSLRPTLAKLRRAVGTRATAHHPERTTP